MLQRLNRSVRYLTRDDRLVWCYLYQRGEDISGCHVDVDWAGDEGIRLSAPRSIERYCVHVLDVNAIGHAVRALGSAELELYARFCGGGRLIHTSNIGPEFGQEFRRFLMGDSAAAHGAIRRRGVRRMRHLKARGLWIRVPSAYPARTRVVWNWVAYPARANLQISAQRSVWPRSCSVT